MNLSFLKENLDLRRSRWHYVSNYPEWSGSNVMAYRIWVLYDGLRWWQRHEWKYHNGSEHMEEWIRGIKGFNHELKKIPIRYI